VRREAYEAEVSGDVSVRGSLTAPDVSGRLEIERAVIRPASLPASGPSIPHDPTIQVAGLPARADEQPPAPAGTEVRGPLTLALQVEIARNAWIRRNDANIEIGGQLSLTKAANEGVRASGEIRLLRGWYAFQGRRFTLDQGTITFAGATPPKPTFDITAVYRTRDYRIEVRITGSAEKPNLTLSSDPPLEQADVLSVLLFGKPASQLGRGQSVALQQQALQLAAGYVMPELRTSVMDALGLDTLEVEMPQGTGGARVSAGRYVAEDVFVSLGQEFGRRAAQVMGVEYDLGANVSVRGSTTTRGNSAIDLFWRYRY
jgi:translocation and assembly module TamB